MDASDLFPWLESRLLGDLRPDVAGPVLAYLNGGTIEALNTAIRAVTGEPASGEVPVGRVGVPVEALTGTKTERRAAAAGRIAALGAGGVPT